MNKMPKGHVCTSERYKGYIIAFNPLYNEYWIEKEGFVIARPPSIENAKYQIDQLV